MDKHANNTQIYLDMLEMYIRETFQPLIVPRNSGNQANLENDSP